MNLKNLLLIFLAYCMSANVLADYYASMGKYQIEKAATIINGIRGLDSPTIGAIFQADSPDQIDIIRIHSAFPIKSSANDYELTIVYEHLYTSYYPEFEDGWNVSSNSKFVRALGVDEKPYSTKIYKGRADLAYLFLNLEGNRFDRIAQLAGVDLIYEDEIESFSVPEGFHELLSTYTYHAYCGASSCDRPSLALRLASGEFQYTETVNRPVFPIIYPVNSSAPSYDCSKASTEVEVLICKSRLLSKLDRDLADYFAVHKAKLKTPYDDTNYKLFLKYHLNWLNSRDACFSSAEYYSPLECLVSVYQEQIHFLSISSSIRPWGED